MSLIIITERKQTHVTYSYHWKETNTCD